MVLILAISVCLCSSRVKLSITSFGSAPFLACCKITHVVFVFRLLVATTCSSHVKPSPVTIIIITI